MNPIRCRYRSIECGVIWDSSKVLANFVFEYEIDNKRILEAG